MGSFVAVRRRHLRSNESMVRGFQSKGYVLRKCGIRILCYAIPPRYAGTIVTFWLPVLYNVPSPPLNEMHEKYYRQYAI
jgi:hypothetical protein